MPPKRNKTTPKDDSSIKEKLAVARQELLDLEAQAKAMGDVDETELPDATKGVLIINFRKLY